MSKDHAAWTGGFLGGMGARIEGSKKGPDLGVFAWTVQDDLHGSWTHLRLWGR